MPRSNSPRAAARRNNLHCLTVIKRTINDLHRRWDVPGTVYRPNPTDANLMGDWVPRAAADYPENNPAAIAYLIRRVDALAHALAIWRSQLVDDYRDVAGQDYTPATLTERRPL
jgi:hypothetical protein